jgi:hypothetical protein
MIALARATLVGNGVRLEPMTLDHTEGLAAAAADGEQECDRQCDHRRHHPHRAVRP